MYKIHRSKNIPLIFQLPVLFLIVLLFLFLSPGISYAQPYAFPGAEGYGAMTTGGRGGAVYEVTNLNDSGTGSLRAAINASGARTIVFRISGTIELQSTLSISKGDITIAGQTAPGDGITLKNYYFSVNADNVIVRYIRSRLGDEQGQQEDAMGGVRQKDIIIDHCTMSWSVDECASFYDNENFTLQWCLLSESLDNSIHVKGDHGYGGIWGGKGATFHHNLLAHHTSRTPRFCGSRYSNLQNLEKIDHRNNVIYNWGDNSCYGAEGGSYNIVNNYYKYGPATSPRNRIIKPNSDAGGNAQPAGVWGSFYITDNYVFGYSSTTGDNWTTGVHGLSAAKKEEVKLTAPHDAPEITEHQAIVAFEHVLSNAGAVLPKRDVLDARIVYETMTGTATYGGDFGVAKGIIDTQVTVGGWPVLESTTAPVDTDQDGMPDEWEDAMGLDKNDPADRNDDKSGNGYTNLEDYLNELVEAYEYVIRPVNFQVDSINGNEVSLSWEDFSDNETGFIIERKLGDNWTEVANLPANDTVFVDQSLDTHGEIYYRIKAINSSFESFNTDSVMAAVVATGISQLAGSGLSMEIYPNPFTDIIRVKYSLEEASDVNLALIDLTGRQVLSIELDTQSPGNHFYEFSGAELNSGIYFIHLKTETSASIARIIRAR